MKFSRLLSISIILSGLIMGGSLAYFFPSTVNYTAEDHSALEQKQTPPNKQLTTLNEKDKPLRSLLNIHKEGGFLNNCDRIQEYINRLRPEEIEAELEKMMPPYEPYAIRTDNVLAHDAIRQMLCERWGELAPKQALNYIQTRLPQNVTFVIKGWASVDPVNAADHFMEMCKNPNMDSSYKALGIQSLISEWAKHDVDETIQWMQQSKAQISGDYQGRLYDVYSVLARQNISALQERLEKGDMSEEEQVAAQDALATEWAGKDWASVKAWLNKIDPKKENSTLQRNAFNALLLSQPELAITEADSLPNDNETATAIKQQIIDYLQNENPRAAYDWILKHDLKGEYRYQSLADRWATRDIDACKAWLRELPASKEKDIALSSVISNRYSSLNYESPIPLLLQYENKNDWWIGCMRDALGYEEEINRLNVDAELEKMKLSEELIRKIKN